MPKRIQRKRSKGWKMPPNTVYVGRPTKWGNPAIAPHDPKWAMETFRDADTLIQTEEGRAEVRNELKGKNLACWCPLDKPCHADVLLDVANS